MAESYNSSVPLVWDISGNSGATAKFVVDSITVVVSFDRREEGGPWHLVFAVQKADETQVAHSAFAIFNGYSKPCRSSSKLASRSRWFLRRNERRWQAFIRPTCREVLQRLKSWVIALKGRLRSIPTRNLCCGA